MTPVPVQIEGVTLAPKSELNPHPYHVHGVCGTCTRCGRTAVANPEAQVGGPKTRRLLAVKALLAELTEGCEFRLPWGLPPAHADRAIPKGVTLFAIEKATGCRSPVAVEKNKLVGVWGGVAPDAVVLVVPEAAGFSLAAEDFAAELAKRGYAGARVAEPEAAKAVP